MSILAQKLSVPIWRVNNGDCPPWHTLGSSNFNASDIKYDRNRYVYMSMANDAHHGELLFRNQIYDNNYCDLDLNSQMVGNNASTNYDNTLNAVESFRVVKPTILLRTIDSMYQLFSTMEQDMNELFESFTMIINNIGENIVAKIDDETLDDTFRD